MIEDWAIKHPLDDLAHAHELRKTAVSNYNRALQRCKAAGISNRKMAEVTGMTEAAIRMHFKRRSAKTDEAG